MQTAYTKAFEIYDEYARQNATFRSIYQQWKAFRSQVYQWNFGNELNYFDFSIKAANY